MKKVELETIYKDDRIIIHKLKGGNKEFIDFIAQKILQYSIHPVVYNFVRTQDLNVEKAFYLAQKYIKYRKDPTKIEGIIAPSKIIEEHIIPKKPIYGDCDDKVLFLGSLLVSMGYPVKVVGAYYSPEGKVEKKINHVYLEYYDDKKKKWIVLEPTSPKTRIGEMGYGVIPIYKVEISYSGGKVNIAKEIVPVEQKTEDKALIGLIKTIQVLKNLLNEAEKSLEAYAEKKGIRYQLLKTAMDFESWIRTPLTWFLLGVLGISLWVNFSKVKRKD